jgi:hypothetical protein
MRNGRIAIAQRADPYLSSGTGNSGDPRLRLSCGSARRLQEAPSAPEPRIPGDEYYHAFPWLNGLRHGVQAVVGVAEAIEFLLKLPRRDAAWLQ